MKVRAVLTPLTFCLPIAWVADCSLEGFGRRSRVPCQNSARGRDLLSYAPCRSGMIAGCGGSDHVPRHAEGAGLARLMALDDTAKNAEILMLPDRRLLSSVALRRQPTNVVDVHHALVVADLVDRAELAEAEVEPP